MTEPIRILQWGMLGGFSGVEAFIMNVYRNMDRSKVQFDFLESHNEGKLAYEDEILAMGGHIYRVMYSQRESLVKSHSELLRFFREHPEFAGIHVNANYPYAFPLKMAKEAGMPLRILHSHNSGSGSQFESQPSGLKALIKTYRDRIVQKQIDMAPTHYFACSQQAADYMFPGRPFIWVKNGIDAGKFAFRADIRQRVRAELGIGDDTKLIGFCGRFRRQENPLFLLEIFAEYARMEVNTKLMLVGIGELEQQMRKKVEELGLADKVMFLGARTDMPDLYQAMDLFLLPSLFEGLALVYMEAQCAGLPCLASKEAMSFEAAVTPLMHACSVRDDARVWADQCRNILNENEQRSDCSNVVRDAGFDIRDVAEELQRFYLEHVK
ncbi:glycosyltransferase [Bifidobacterium dentium]|uniref:glycosyltransferase n=1 Tax=Bifidobacterium dentium TaxID=1689 RepID=UPI003D17F139